MMGAMRAPAYLFLLLAAACGESAEVTEAAPITAPERSAAGDEALRRMVMDVAQHRACEVLRDRFVPLPEHRPPATRRPRTVGRLWVSDCNVTREGDALRVHLEGRGWQWADEIRAGPLGSSFSVRGTVRFEATIDLFGELDLRYDEPTRRAQVIVTPREGARVRVSPIGSVPVAPSGGWSGLVGGLGGLIGLSPQAQAREQLEAQGAARIRAQLARGVTLTFDLCTGQLDPVLGALGEGEAPPAPPYPQGRWIDNAETVVHPGALDVAGPFEVEGGALLLEAERLDGPAPELLVLCRSDAALLAASFLASGRARASSAASRTTLSSPARVDLSGSGCEAPHVVLLSSGGSAARVRYRVIDPEAEAEALVSCD